MDREIVKEESMYDFYREQTLLLTEKYKELKERIDKAIEYIEEEITQGTDIYCKEKVDGIIVLEILKGSDKE